MAVLLQLVLGFSILHSVELTWGSLNRNPSFHHRQPAFKNWKSGSSDKSDKRESSGSKRNAFMKDSKSSDVNAFNKWRGEHDRSSGSNEKSSKESGSGMLNQHRFHWPHRSGSASGKKTKVSNEASTSGRSNLWRNRMDGSHSRHGLFQNWRDKSSSGSKKHIGLHWLLSKFGRNKHNTTESMKDQVSAEAKDESSRKRESSGGISNRSDSSKSETDDDKMSRKDSSIDSESSKTEKSETKSEKSEKKSDKSSHSKKDSSKDSNSSKTKKSERKSEKSEKKSDKSSHSKKDSSKDSNSSKTKKSERKSEKSEKKSDKSSHSKKDSSKDSNSSKTKKSERKSEKSEKKSEKSSNEKTKSETQDHKMSQEDSRKEGKISNIEKSKQKSEKIDIIPVSEKKSKLSEEEETSKQFHLPKDKSKPFQWPIKDKSQNSGKSKAFPWPTEEKSKVFPFPPKEKSKVAPPGEGVKDPTKENSDNKSGQETDSNVRMPFPPREKSKATETDSAGKSKTSKTKKATEQEELPRFGPIMKPPYKKPKACKTITPSCCVGGELTVKLNNARGKKSQGKLDGVTVIEINKGQGRDKRQSCSSNALVMVDFDKIDTTGCFGCLEAPYCGKRMLKIELKLSNAKRSGWMFNVGDSESNDGYRGDSDLQKNDAETQALYPNITIYPSDKCPTISSFMHIINAVANSVDTVTLYISNEHIRITNSDGLDFKLCHKCLYALNGQPDDGPNGGPNERICIGLNRVVKDLSRTGYGVCSAKFSWECPWCI